MGFPDNCIRGIPNADFLTDGFPATHLFYFTETPDGHDGRWELSINWEDDDWAIQFTLTQKKDTGEIQFKEGVARIPREEIDRISAKPMVNGNLSYERRTQPDNPYHGNLLLPLAVPKPAMKQIAASLALSVSEIICQEES